MIDTLGKLPHCEDASSNLQANVEQTKELCGLSYQVIYKFGDALEKVGELRYKVSKVKLLLAPFFFKS